MIIMFFLFVDTFMAVLAAKCVISKINAVWVFYAYGAFSYRIEDLT